MDLFPETHPRRAAIYVSRHIQITAEILDPAAPVSVSFSPADIAGRPWGPGLAMRRRINRIDVRSAEMEWFQYPEVPEAQAALRDALAAFPRVILDGSSMGGYAALSWSGAVRADAVLAYAPQVAIGPGRPAGDTRWGAALAKVAERFGFPHDDMASNVSRTARIVVVIDPRNPDAAHVAQLAAIRPVEVLFLPLAGHAVLGAMAGLGLASRLLLDLLHDRLDAAAWQAEIHRARRLSHRTWRVAQARLARGRAVPPPLIRRAAGAADPGDGKGLRRLAAAAAAQGLDAEAAALFAGALRDPLLALDRNLPRDVARSFAPLMARQGMAGGMGLRLAAAADRAETLWEALADTPGVVGRPVAERLGAPLQAVRDALALAAAGKARELRRRLLLVSASFHHAAGDARAAREVLARAAALADAWDPGLIEVAQGFAESEAFGEAEALLERRLRREPGDLAAATLRAEVAERAGRWEAVPDLWTAALAAGAAPDRTFPRRVRALLRLRREEAALAALAAWGSALPAASRLRGEALARLGRHEEAVAAYDAALLPAEDASVLRARSEALLKLGRLAAARADARRAAALAPGNAGHGRHLARVEALCAAADGAGAS